VIAEFRREPQPQPAAQTREAVRGNAQSARSRDAAPAGADGVRGCPLDRPDLARALGSDRRPGAASAGAARDHLSPRIPAPLERPPPCHDFALNRLGERDGEVLVQKLAGNAALTPDIVA